jgi:transcription antitermination factor NusG
MDSSWAVVWTQANRERTAELNAARQGYTCFLPYGCLRIGSREPSVQVLFPRYFFVKVVGAWRSLLGTIGVCDVIRGTGGGPAIVPPGEVEQLLDRHRERGYIDLNGERFFQGQRVKVGAGPLSGLEGVFDGMVGWERSKVLLTWLGGVCSVELRERDLEPA